MATTRANATLAAGATVTQVAHYKETIKQPCQPADRSQLGLTQKCGHDGRCGHRAAHDGEEAGGALPQVVLCSATGKRQQHALVFTTRQTLCSAACLQTSRIEGAACVRGAAHL